MSRFSVPALAALLVALTGPAPVRADPVEWTYDWVIDLAEIPADAPGTGVVQFTNSAGTGAGASDAVAVNLVTVSAADPSSPDILANGAYNLTLFLNDTASGEGGALFFSGSLSGTWSAGHAALENQFTGETTQTLTLGDNVYTVVLGPYSPPGPPTSTNAGSISSFISVEGVGQEPPPPPVNQAPEPTSLVLAAAALTVLGSRAGTRRWRARTVNATA